MIRWTTILVILSFGTGLRSQNLLYNGSFEDCFGCPDEPGALKVCEYWSIPNHTTPDLFKRCSHATPYLEIPYNFIGTQEPKSGSAYGGIILLEGSDRYRDYREYIQGELKETLQANTQYKVTFYISWAEYSNYFCDRIGYLFSADQLIPKPKEPEPKKRKKKKRQEPEGQSPLNTILPTSDGYVSLHLDTIVDRESWHKVEFTYQAKGGERYMILGLFDDNATEKDYERYTSEVFGKPLRIGQASYYYIDDISVEKSAFTHH